MTTLGELVIRELLQDSAYRYLIRDPQGWLQDPSIAEAAESYRIVLIPAGESSSQEIAEVQSLAQRLDRSRGEQIALLLPDLASTEAWRSALGPEWMQRDVQPITIFPGLDPDLTGQMSAAEVATLLPRYGGEVRATRGRRKTAWILLSELYGIELKRVQSLDGLFEEGYRLHAIGSEPPFRWVELVESDLPQIPSGDISAASCLTNESALIQAIKDAIGARVIKAPGWSARLTHLEADVTPAPFMPTPATREPWLPPIDPKATLDEVERQSWGDLDLNQWAKQAPLLARFALLEELQPAGQASDLRRKLDEAFMAVVTTDYRHLLSSPFFARPPIVHMIPDYLATKWRDTRTALLVLDCLSLPSWLVLQYALRSLGVEPEEIAATYAWVPTITSVSRQALLSGTMPKNFSETITSTSAEEQAWSSFWQRRRHLDDQVELIKAADTKSKEVMSAAQNPDLKRLAVVFNAIDDIIHVTVKAKTLRWIDIHRNLVMTWTREVLFPALEGLLNNGWVVFITSDHGAHKVTRSLEAHREGVKTESEGRRMRIYTDRRFVTETMTEGSLWEASGTLPENYYVLLAPPGAGYGLDHGWTHGSISWDELLVPFVRFGGSIK